MLKSIFLPALCVAIAILGGAGSVWMALGTDFEFDTVSVGDWTAFPARGTPDADPYSKARFSRTAELALGQGEGLTFIARRDHSGEQLRASCEYRLEGPLPPARFWTLYARDAAGRVVIPSSERASALHSYALLRQADNTVSTTVSRHPSPGNWLAIHNGGTFSLVLSLYDTAIASNSRIGEVELPTIIRGACDE
jgi:hypothetical protein